MPVLTDREKDKITRRMHLLGLPQDREGYAKVVDLVGAWIKPRGNELYKAIEENCVIQKSKYAVLMAWAGDPVPDGACSNNNNDKLLAVLNRIADALETDNIRPIRSNDGG